MCIFPSDFLSLKIYVSRYIYYCRMLRNSCVLSYLPCGRHQPYTVASHSGVKSSAAQRHPVESESVSCSVVSDSVAPWTVAHQATLSMEFSRQEYWSGLPYPSPRDLPDPGVEPGSPTLQADFLQSEPPGKQHPVCCTINIELFPSSLCYTARLVSVCPEILVFLSLASM